MKNLHFIPYAACVALALLRANAEPIREWDWHLPASVYKELEFSDRAQVDRAVKIFQQAIDAERRREKVTDLVPRYRAAAGEWRKVQVQAESGDGNESLLAYAVFMQGYARHQAHDRNEAVRLYNEVLDIYPEEKFIAVPARYLLSAIRRELGDIRQANAELESIVGDPDAEGHVIFYNALRSQAHVCWAQDKVDEAAEFWSRIVFSKRRPDPLLWQDSRNNLILARIVSGDFENLEKALFAGLAPEKKAERVSALVNNAKWMSETVRNGWHGVNQYLQRKWPDGRQAGERRAQMLKIRKAYIAWFEGEKAVFEGYDDGWTWAVSELRTHCGIEASADFAKRVRALEPLVRSAKPEQVAGRARTLASELVGIGEAEGARAACDFVRDHFARLRLHYDIECALGSWKVAAQYLEEYIGSSPAPAPDALKAAKYDLAALFRTRLGEHEKAVKIYRELDDPPRSLWGLAEALRDSGKKSESYQTLVEITSMFPDNAAEAVLRTAQWKERDGEKDAAIALYRRLLSHPKWKQSRAASDAHQALERFGVATGGAMTNEVR